MSTLFQLLLVTLCITGYFAKNPPLEKIFYDINDANNIFADFVEKYNKRYKDDDEYALRLKIFKEQLKSLNKLNAEHAETSFGINQFSDMTFEEFTKTYTGAMPDHHVARTTYEPVGNAPASLDYRQKGYVTPVKNQGQCLSCYIFSAIGAIEGVNAMKHGQLVSLSEQQYLDCGNGEACSGGYPLNVMTGLASQGGSETEQDYPYVASPGTCQFDAKKVAVKVLGGESLDTGGEANLKDALANNGPLSISLTACDSFQGYRGGIFYDNCPGPVNHALLLVGYGNENGQEYWIIKNSWDTTWGEQGYMRMAIGSALCNMGSHVYRASV